MPDTPSIRRAAATVRARWCVLVCCTALVSLYLGCAPHTHKQYQVLSFFFDGVPDPSKPAAGAGSAAWRGATAPGQTSKSAAYLHRPFTEGKCESCHASRTNLTLILTRNTCLDCHQKVMNAQVIMHAPVTHGQCLWCHAAHDSPFKGLLKAASPLLCQQCHESALLSDKTPGHRDEKADCLQCHLAHGGADKNLLRVDKVPATHPVAVAEGGNP